jgi:hypothetical protein
MVDLDMGAWRTQNLDPTVPVYSLVANEENRKDEWIASSELALENQYSWGRLEVFEGPHSWGPVEYHEEALFWLAEVRSDPGFLPEP